VNLFAKKFYLPEEDRWVSLTVSAAGNENHQQAWNPACPSESEGTRIH
jgi:hypothetical protein